jgi:hypothetical protein
MREVKLKTKLLRWAQKSKTVNLRNVDRLGAAQKEYDHYGGQYKSGKT